MTPDRIEQAGPGEQRFPLRRYEVTVGHSGSGIYLAKSRGRALADAWRSDAFEGYTFGEFLKMARCRLTDWQLPAMPITVCGKPAFYVDHNSQYVQFVYPNGDFVRNAHPYDVEPEQFRPSAYRSAILRAGEGI